MIQRFGPFFHANICLPVCHPPARKKALSLSPFPVRPPPPEKCYKYKIYTYDFRKGLCRLTGPSLLPVSPGSELSWIGLADTLVPVTMDSVGVVRMLLNKSAWYPVIETKSHLKGMSEYFFLTSVHQHHEHLRGIRCRGSKYPQTIPRPSLSTLPFAAPMCSTGDIAEIELKLNNINFIKPVAAQSEELMSKTGSEEIECLMKLFALACRCVKLGESEVLAYFLICCISAVFLTHPVH